MVWVTFPRCFIQIVPVQHADMDTMGMGVPYERAGFFHYVWEHKWEVKICIGLKEFMQQREG